MALETGNPTPPCSRGFTLVEVLISITLFAVALTLLLGGLRFTSRAWDAGERVTRQTADLETVHRVFSSMLDRFFPVSMQHAESEGYAFQGSSSRLRFAAQLPPYPGPGGLYTVEFKITSERNLNRLELGIAPFNAQTFADNELKTDEKSLLIESTGTLIFSYYGNTVAEQWQSDWPQLKPPPQAVKLQFPEGETRWPDIVVPISIDMDLACAFPLMGGQCRLAYQ